MVSSTPARWLIRILMVFVIIGAVIALLLAGVWAFSPYFLHQKLSKYLAPSAIELTSDTLIRYNPFLARITARNFGLAKKGRLTVSVDSADINLVPSQLLSGNIRVTSVLLSGLNLDIQRTEDGLEIGGYTISGKKDEKQGFGLSSFPFALLVDRFELVNSRVLYRTAKENHLIEITGFSFNHLNLNLDQKELFAKIDTEIFGGILILRFDLDLDRQNFGVIGAKARIVDMDLSNFGAYFPNTGLDLAGKISFRANVEFSLSSGAIHLFLSESRLQTKSFLVKNEFFELIGGNQRLDLEKMTMRFGRTPNSQKEKQDDKTSVDEAEASIINSFAKRFKLDSAKQSQFIKLASGRVSDGKRVIDIPFSAFLSELRLRNADMRLRVNQQEEAIHIENLLIKDLALSRENQAMTARLDARNKTGSLSLASKMSFSGINDGNITAAIVVKKLDLDRLQPRLQDLFTSLTGDLSIRSNVRLRIKNDEFTVSAPNISARPTGFAASNELLAISTKDEDFKINGLSVLLKRSNAGRDSKPESTAANSVRSTVWNAITAAMTVSELRLPSSTLQFKTGKKTETVQLTSTFLKNLRLSRDAKSLTLDLKSKAFGGTVGLKSDIKLAEKASGKIETRLVSDNIDLGRVPFTFPSSFGSVEGIIGLNGNLNIEFKNNEATLSLMNAALKVNDLALSSNQFSFSGGNQQIPLHQVTLYLQGQSTPPENQAGSGDTRNALPEEPVKGGKSKPENKRLQAYRLKIPELEFRDGRLHLKDQVFGYPILIETFSLSDFTIGNDQTNFLAEINASTLSDSLRLYTWIEYGGSDDGRVRTDYDARNVELGHFKQLLPDNIDSIAGSITTKGSFDLRFDDRFWTIQSDNIRAQLASTSVRYQEMNLSSGNQTFALNDVKLGISRQSESESSNDLTDNLRKTPQADPLSWKFRAGDLKVRFDDSGFATPYFNLKGKNQSFDLSNFQVEARKNEGLNTTADGGLEKNRWIVQTDNAWFKLTSSKLSSRNLNLDSTSQLIELKDISAEFLNGGKPSFQENHEGNSVADSFLNIENQLNFRTGKIAMTLTASDINSPYVDINGKKQTVVMHNVFAEGKNSKIATSASKNADKSRESSSKLEWSFGVGKLNLRTDNSRFDSKVIDLSGEKQSISIVELSASKKGDGDLQISARGSINSDESRLDSVYKLNRRYEWEKLVIADASFAYPAPNDAFSVELKDIAFNRLTEISKAVIPVAHQPFLDADLVKIDKMSISDNHVLMGFFDITGLEGNFIIDKKGEFKNLVWIDRTEEEKAKRRPETDPHFRIDKLTITDSKKIDLRNGKVTPVDARDMTINRFEMTGIDNRSSKPSQFKITGTLDQYASYDLLGKTRLFDNKFDIGLSGKVTEVSLPSLMPYIKNTLGAGVRAGQLDAEFDFTFGDEKLEGTSNLLLRNMHLGAEQDARWEEFQESTSYSINTIFWLLSDDDNNIRLEVPFSGRMDDPDFKLDGLLDIALNKAFSTAVRTALLGTVIPNATLLSITWSLSKKFLRIQFDDLIFNPTETKIDSSKTESADYFVGLLINRPGLQVRLCGIAVPDDVGSSRNGKKFKEEVTRELNAISVKRAEELKKYVIQKGKIESSRLMVCSPQIDYSRGAKPRIEIDI